MKILVEFAGVSRVLTGAQQVSLELETGATFEQIVRELAAQYPKLVGTVIHPDQKLLMASNMLNVNGQHMLQPSQMTESPQDGDRIILMSILAGG